MYPQVDHTINNILQIPIADARKEMLHSLAHYIQAQLDNGHDIRIQFVCTHNSRRSHLAQVWAQTAAMYYGIPAVYCYSGGTEETALFTKVRDTLVEQGFEIQTLASGANPIYYIKPDPNAAAIIGFSKKYDHPFNPSSHFAAVMTCSTADVGCPFIAGATSRYPITFEDPKVSDGTPQQSAIYQHSSKQIASEMFYIFSLITPAVCSPDSNS